MNRTYGIISLSMGALAIIIVGAYFVWFAPTDYRGEKYIFTVENGQSINQIIGSLKEEGFIRSTFGTKVAFKLSRAGSVQVGTYNVSPRMDAWQIAGIIGGSETATVKTTIPEGYTISQIADTLDEKGIITADDFLSAAQNYPSDDSLLKNRGDDSMEGYLFPDTYNINKGTPAKVLIEQMFGDFSQRIKPLESDVAKSKYNLHQIITLASLVEKEARTDGDRKLIAGVLINRLNTGMRLDVDATIRYVTNNWKDPISQKDINSSSPYNTRKFAGLPPGPICNPGLAAIKAVLSPTKSNYLYYLTDSDGATHYAKTLDQHNANKAKYLT